MSEASIVVAVFGNGFQQQLGDWCGWVRHYGMEFTVEHGAKGWREVYGNDWGADVVRMDERNAECLRVAQEHNPARFGTPWNKVDMRTGRLLTT